MILQKSYDINTTFIVLNQSNFPNNKILNWKDKSSGFIYESDKEYKIEGDIDLLAVLDSNKKTKEEGGESNSNNKSNKVILIVAICIIAVFILLVIAFLIRRHFKIKKWKEVDSKVFETKKADNTKQNYIIN